MLNVVCSYKPWVCQQLELKRWFNMPASRNLLKKKHKGQFSVKVKERCSLFGHSISQLSNEQE